MFKGDCQDIQFSVYRVIRRAHLLAADMQIKVESFGDLIQQMAGGVNHLQVILS